MTGLRRRTLLFVVVTLAALLPPVAFLAAAWFQTTHEKEALLKRYAASVIDRADDILGSADSTLAGMVQHLEPRCTPATVAALQRTVFESIYFREADLSSGGTVLCTSDRTEGSSQTVNDDAVLPAQGIHISPPQPRPQNGTASIVIHRRAADGKVFGLHLNPVLLGDPVHRYAAEDGVTLLVERDDGTYLSRFGYSANTPPEKLNGKQVIQHSKSYPLRVVAVGSPFWFLHSWRRNAVIFTLVGLFASALLTLLVLYLAQRQFSRRASLHDALISGQFHVYYQPVLDTESGLCVGAEALLRWHHPQLGVMLPGTFIPAAEESGFIVELTKWLMDRVVTDMASLLKENPRLYVSLNLSPLHFEDPKLFADVKAILGRRVSPSQVVFEVTESQLIMNDNRQALQTLQNVRAMGAPLAIDDFGSGYSSLKYLSRFPFDYLKIDKTFVDAIGTESVTAGLVDTIVQMANQLKLKIVAEGVETAVQLSYLRRLKVNCVQGWLFSKALPANQFYAYVADNRNHVLGTAAPQRSKYR